MKLVTTLRPTDPWPSRIAAMLVVGVILTVSALELRAEPQRESPEDAPGWIADDCAGSMPRPTAPGSSSTRTTS